MIIGVSCTFQPHSSGSGAGTFQPHSSGSGAAARVVVVVMVPE